MNGKDTVFRAWMLALVLALAVCFGAVGLAEAGGPEPVTLMDIDYTCVVDVNSGVELSLPQIDGADSFDVSLWSLGQSWSRIASQTVQASAIPAGGQALTLSPAGGFSAGVYALRVVQYDADDGIQDAWQRPVTAYAETPENTIAVTLSSTHASAGTNGLGVTVWAPGASSGVLVVGNMAYDFEGDYHGEIENIGFSENGTYPVYALACYGESVARSSVQYVQVDDQGALGEWNVTGCPGAVVDPDDGFTLSVPPVGNAAQITADGTNIFYEVYIYDITADETVVEERFKQLAEAGDRTASALIGPGRQIAVGAADLQEGHDYFFYAGAGAYGCATQYDQRYFTVRDGQYVAAAPSLSLLLDGETYTSGEVTLPADEEILVHVDIPAGATAVRVFSGNYFEYMNDWREWSAWSASGEIEFSRRLWSARRNLFYAQFYYGDVDGETDYRALDWGPQISNAVTVLGSGTTTLEAPEFTLSDSAVTQGDVLVVNVQNAGNGADFVTASAENLQTGEWFDRYEWDGATIRIPTAGMEPGVYRICVENESNSHWGGATYSLFRVLGIDGGADRVLLSLDRTEVQTHRQVRATAYAGDEDGFELEDLSIIVTDEEGGRDDERHTGRRSIDEVFGGWGDARTLTFQAKAVYRESGVDPELAERRDYYSDPVTVIITAPNGRLDDPAFLSVPSIIEAGSPLSFTFTADEDTEWTYINLHYTTDEWRFVGDADIEADDGAWGYTFAPYLLDEPGQYEIGLHANADGYSGGHASRRVAVVDSLPAQSATLAVLDRQAEADGSYTVLSSEDIRFRIQAEGATAFRVLNQDAEWEYWTEEDGEALDGSVEFEWGFGSGAFSLYAQASCTPFDVHDDYDPESFDWTIGSNTIDLNVLSPGGRLPEPDVAMTPAEPQWGDDLVFSIAPVEVQPGEDEINEWYWADVHVRREYPDGGYDWEWLFHTDWNGADRNIIIPTGVLDPGDYEINIHNDAVGWDSNETRVTLTLPAPSEGVPQIRAASDRNVVPTHGEFRVYMSARDAESVRLRVTREGDDWEDERSDGRQQASWTFSYDQSGTYLFTPYGYYYNPDTDTYDEIPGEPATVEVVSNGRLAGAVADVPAVLTLGSSLDVTFEPVTGAQWYYTDLFYHPENGDAEWLGESNLDGDATAIHYDAALFNRTGRYELSIDAHAFGMDSSYMDYDFVVMDAGVVQDISLRVTVDGVTYSGDTTIDLPSSKDVRVSVLAPEATALRLFRQHGQDTCWKWDGPTWMNRDWSFDDGVISLFAIGSNADYDTDYDNWEADVPWTRRSNVITLRVTSPSGPLTPPDIELVSSTVVRGEDLIVNIAPIDVQPGEDEIGEWYWADAACWVADDQDGHWEWQWAGEWDGEKIAVNTLRLEPGECQLSVHNDAVGWSGQTVTIPFTVTAPSAPIGISAQADRQTVQCGERFNVFAFAPGAGDVGVKITRDGEPQWEDRRDDVGSSSSWGLEYVVADTYHITPCGWYEGETGPRWGEPIDVEVTSSGALVPPVIRVSPTVEVGDPLTVSFDSVFGAQWYDLELIYRDEQDNWQHLYSTTIDASGSDESFAFDGSWISQPGVYLVNVGAGAIGKDCSGVGTAVLALDPQTQTDPRISLSLLYGGAIYTQGTVEALKSEALRVRVDAPNATAVRILNGDHWDTWWQDGDPEHIECDWGFGTGGATLVAQASFDDYDDSQEGWEQSVQWKAVSNAIRVNISAPYGMLNAPAASLASPSVQRGDVVTINIAPQGHGEWYWAEIYGERHEGTDSWWENLMHLDWSGSAHAIRFSTIGLESGTYKARVSNDCVGWESNGVTLQFTVTDAQQPIADITAAVVPAPVDTEEDLNVFVYARGANGVQPEITRDGDPDWSEWRGQGGDNGCWQFSFSQADAYHATAYGYYDGEPGPRVGETIDFSVTASGTLMPPLIQVPATIQAGNALTGTIAANAGVEWYWVGLTYCPEEEGWRDLANFRVDANADGSANLSFSANSFTTPGVYRIFADACAVGKNSSGSDAQLVVVEPGSTADGNLQLSVLYNGTVYTSGSVNVNSSQDIAVRAMAPGATAMRILDGDHWRHWWKWENPEYVHWNCSFGAGSRTLVAQACYADYDTDYDGWEQDVQWGDVSNAIRLDITSPQGMLNAPAATLSSPSVQRGESVTINIAPQGHGEWYWADIYGRRTDAQGSWWENVLHLDWDAASQRIRINTIGLEPGDYRAKIGNDASGWEGSETWLSFTVTPSQTEIPDIAAVVDPASVQTSEEFRVYVYAQGADGVSMKITRDDDYGWEDWRSDGGNYCSWNYSCDQPGTYRITPYGYFGDVDASIPGEPIVFSVTSTGALRPPVIRVPGMISVGDPIIGSIEPVDGAGWYDLDLNYRDENGEWHYVADGRVEQASGNIAFTMDGALIQRAGLYKVDVNARAFGKAGSHAHTTILVKDGPAEPSVELTVDYDGTTYSGSAVVEAHSSCNLHVTVNAPDATAVRILNGDSWNTWWRWDDPEHIECDWGFSTGGATLVAQACYADYDTQQEGWEARVPWTAISNAIRVNISSPFGALDAPDATMSATSIPRGEFASIGIGTQDHGEWYWADVQRLRTDGESSWLEHRMHIDWNREDSEIRFSTISLPVGEYIASVGTDCEGWDGAETLLHFTVTEPMDPIPDMTVVFDRSTIYTNQEFRVYAYAAGANHVTVEISREDDPNWTDWRDEDGESGSWTFMYGAADTYNVRLYGYYDGESEPREADHRFTFAVTSNGMLAQPVIRVPAAIEVGQPLNGSIDRVDGAQWYSVSLHYLIGDGNWRYLEEQTIDADGNDSVSFGFGGGSIQEAGVYKLDVNACAVGMDSGHESTSVMALAADATPSVALSVEYDGVTYTSGTVEAISRRNLHVTVDAPNATAVRILNGDFWNTWWVWDEPERVECDWFFGTGGATLVAQACYTDYDTDYDGWEQDVPWTAVSNAIRVNVTSPNGRLDVPNASMASSPVARGDDAVINIVPQNRGEWYWAEVDGETTDGENTWWEHKLHADWDENNNTIRFNTLRLKPGNYKAYVGVDSEGYDRNERVLDFVVGAPAEPIPAAVAWTDRASALVLEDFNIYAYAEDADWVEVIITMEEGGDWEDRRSAGGEYGEWRMNYMVPDTYTITPVAHYGENSVTGAPATIVLGTLGTLVAPQQDFPELLFEGDDLEFSFGSSDDADFYKLVVFNYGGNDEYDIVNFDFDQPGSYVLEDYMYSGEEQIEAGNIYKLVVSAWGDGYSAGWPNEQDVHYMAVVDPDKVMTLPAYLSEIEDEAFEGIGAQMVVIPDGVTSIGSHAFAYCPNLVAVVIPDSVTNIDANAFDGCRNGLVFLSSY